MIAADVAHNLLDDFPDATRHADEEGNECVSLSNGWRVWIEDSDGGVFWALYSPDDSDPINSGGWRTSAYGATYGLEMSGLHRLVCAIYRHAS